MSVVSLELAASELLDSAPYMREAVELLEVGVSASQAKSS